MRRLSVAKKLGYATGQFGWSLSTFGVSNLLAYFYLPAETEGEVLSLFISQHYILGVMTLLGIIAFSGRFFDAITDPWIANLSDRFKGPLDRRRFFMLISALPMALFGFLVFYPPVDGVSQWNALWLALMLFGYFLAFTAYTVPYTALLSELTEQPEERIGLATWIAVAWAGGFILGNSVYAIQAAFEQWGMSSLEAFQWSILGFSLISLVLTLVPVFALRTRDLVVQTQSDLPLLMSLKSILADLNFRRFIIADLLYWVALTFVQVGFAYYVLVLLQLERAIISLYLQVMLLSSFLYYWPINALAKRYGHRPLLVFAFALFCLVFLLNASLGYWPIPPFYQGLSVALLAGMPLAIFAILPNALIADAAAADAMHTGQARAAMFFAVRNFMMKLGISLANFLFPSILLLGKSIDQDLGIRLAAMAAFGFCLIGLSLMWHYRDPTGHFDHEPAKSVLKD